MHIYLFLVGQNSLEKNVLLLIHRKVLSLNWHGHCCLSVRCIVCSPERRHSLGLKFDIFHDKFNA